MGFFSDLFASIGELFSIKIEWDFYVVLMLLAFILMFILGYKLIAAQIKLVKAEIFSFSDYLKCIVYSLIFASGTTIIITLMMIFAEYSTVSRYLLFPVTGDLTPVLLWPVWSLTIFLLIFPLFDFLYMAHSILNKGLTFFQEFFADKFIHKSENKYVRYLIAFILWIILYIMPPSILTSLGIPIIISYTSWAIFFPMVIVIYFGVRGYLAGVVNSYYRIPSMGRNLFLSFENLNRFGREFKDDPTARIAYGLQVFLYFWQLNTISTLFGKLFAPKYVNIPSGFEWTIFISLFFGIYGYFSRFWTRKVKFRWMDILFAAWLIAATGVNVWINYTVLNPDMFNWIYLHWSETIKITQNNIWPSGNFLLFVPAASIEEITLFVLITYYVISKNPFWNQTKYSYIDVAAQDFKPIPLFNLIRVSQQNIREHAKEELKTMYSRIPYKKELKLTDRKFMDPLFDALCDWNKNSNEVARIIISDFIVNNPEQIANKVNEILSKKNIRLVDELLDLILINDSEKKSIISQIPIETVNSLLCSKSYIIKRKAIKLLQYRVSGPGDIDILIIQNLINDSDYYIQIETLKLVSQFAIPVHPRTIISKINHPDKTVKSAALLALSGISTATIINKENEQHKRYEQYSQYKNYEQYSLFEQFGGDLLDEKENNIEENELISGHLFGESMIKMLDNPDWTIRSSILNGLSKVSNIVRLNLPFKILLNNLIDTHEEVQKSSGVIIKRYLLELRDLERKAIGELPALDESSFKSSGKEQRESGKELKKDRKTRKLEKKALKEAQKITQIHHSEEYLRELISLLDPTDVNRNIVIFSIINECWNIKPDLLVDPLIRYIKSENKRIRSLVSDTLVNIGKTQYSDLIFLSLLSTQDELTYLKRGVIADTLVKMCIKNHKLIDGVLENLNNENETVRINCAVTLEGQQMKILM